MSSRTFYFSLSILSVFLFLASGCNENAEEKQALPPHLEKLYTRLNGFVDELYSLHKKRLEGRKIYTTEETGGYGGLTNDLEFFNEIKYYDASSRRLLSTIKWERKHPGNIHMIDLFVYDKHGRLKRKYSASYLPDRRVSPLETLITLHYYNNNTHSFREFDATDVQLYEQCSDIENEENTYFAYHYEDIPESFDELDVENRRIYRACFDHASSTAEPYLSPLNELTATDTDS